MVPLTLTQIIKIQVSSGNLYFVYGKRDLGMETGVELSRATLDGWVMRVGELLRPITTRVYAHAERVAGLAASLWRDGLKVFFDQYRGDDEEKVPLANLDGGQNRGSRPRTSGLHRSLPEEGSPTGLRGMKDRECVGRQYHLRPALRKEAEPNQVPPGTVLACG